ncbi:hypothetical protein AB0J90_00135 [Micromonospora sp. NPDC049523]|uniref:hypothetical protein n=1 Tax=Micromonospora sp. NPDC049523 TaxID=3155921 RepID=UPI00343DEBAB
MTGEVYLVDAVRTPIGRYGGALAGVRPDDLAALNPDLVNPQGGAIALGHPLGSSGSRILGSLAWQLHRRGGGFGLAAICIGVGQGLAVVLEAC